MGVYNVSEESIQYFTDLSTELKNLSTQLAGQTETLLDAIDKNQAGLGYHIGDIKHLLEMIKEAGVEVNGNLNTLSTKALRAAAKRQHHINTNRYKQGIAAGAAAGAAGVAAAAGASGAAGNGSGAAPSGSASGGASMPGGSSASKAPAPGTPIAYPAFTGAGDGQLQESYGWQSNMDAGTVGAEAKAAILDYSMQGYEDMNRVMDGRPLLGGEANRAAARAKSDQMAAGIEKCSLTNDTTLSRGQSIAEMFGSDFESMPFDELKAKYEGKYYEKPGFVSTSTSDRIANDFAQGKASGGMVLTIHAPKGTKAVCMGQLSAFQGQEQEVVIQRGSIFKINQISNDGGMVHVDVTVAGRRL